jgi:hypothetical protein
LEVIREERGGSSREEREERERGQGGRGYCPMEARGEIQERGAERDRERGEER